MEDLTNKLECFVKTEKLNAEHFHGYEEIKQDVLEVLKKHEVTPNTAGELLNHISEYYLLEQTFRQSQQ